MAHSFRGDGLIPDDLKIGHLPYPANSRGMREPILRGTSRGRSEASQLHEMNATANPVVLEREDK